MTPAAASAAIDSQIPLAVIEMEVAVVDQLYVELEPGVAGSGLEEAEIRLPAVQAAAEVQRVAGELVVGDGVLRPPIGRPVGCQWKAGRKVDRLRRLVPPQVLRIIGA